MRLWIQDILGRLAAQRKRTNGIAELYRNQAILENGGTLWDVR